MVATAFNPESFRAFDPPLRLHKTAFGHLRLADTPSSQNPVA
jgi:hypothetical protein